jgi:hypothetical protein
MCRFISPLLAFGLALFCFVGTSPMAFGQNTKKDDTPPKSDKTDDKGAPKKKIVAVATYPGKLIKLEEDSFKMEVTIGKYKETIDIVIDDDVKVRMPVDVEFDDKGRPKRPKKDPNDKDSRLGGVKGAREDLANGQDIVVTVGQLPNRKLIATIIKVVKKVDK